MSPRGSSTSSAVIPGDTQSKGTQHNGQEGLCLGLGGTKITPKVLAEVLCVGQDPQMHGEGTGPGSAPAPQALLSPSKGWGPSLSPQEPLDRAEPPQGCFGEQEQH